MTGPEQITADVQHAADHPEGVSVLVVTPDEKMARLAGPMLARRLYPGRTFGKVLHVEWMGSRGGFEVVVREFNGGAR